MARSADISDIRSSDDGLRSATAASKSFTYVQQLVGCVFGGALALSLLILTAFVLCRRSRRAGRRRAEFTKATAASTFRLFGVGCRHPTSVPRDDSTTLTSTGKTTSNGVSSFSNCSMSAGLTADYDVDNDDDYDVTTLARCFRFPNDVIQARQLPKPPPPPPPVPSPYQPHYLAGVLSCLRLSVIRRNSLFLRKTGPTLGIASWTTFCAAEDRPVHQQSYYLLGTL